MSLLILRALRPSTLPQFTSQNLSKRFLFPLQTTPLYQHRQSSTSPASTPKSNLSAADSKVNGPPSTLPAPLVLPTRLPDQPFLFKYAFTLGKAYATFYKTGVKNIFNNFVLSRPLVARIDKEFGASIPKALAANALSRSDFQLLLRNKHDIKRVPVFALVFMICGEFTPLVVLLVSNVVPWTCRIPKQIEGDRRTLEERRKISFRNLTSYPPEGGVEQLDRQQLIHISWSLGLSSKMWDWLGGRYPGLPTGVLRKKVERRVQYLRTDDRLVERGGGVSKMDIEEVRMALVERGVDVLGVDERKLRELLRGGLKATKKVGVETLLLTR
jgi:hypothetical protein